jgi:hypothetical protein
MTDSPDVLSDNELPALRFLLQFGSQFGPAAGPLNAGQWRGYCGWLSSLDAAYAEIENPTVKTFVDQYFTLLMDVPSQAVPGAQLSFKQLYVVYAYDIGCRIADNWLNGGRPYVWQMGEGACYFHVFSGTWKDMWDLFANGYDWPFGGQLGPWDCMNSARYIDWSFLYATDPSITTWRDGFTNDVVRAWADEWGDYSDEGKRIIADHAKSAVRRPTLPIWKQATDDVMHAWAAAPPPEVIHRASGPVTPTPRQDVPIADLAITEGYDAINAAEAVLSKWTDFPAVQAATAPAWGGTLTDEAKALLRDSSALSGDQYSFCCTC